MPGLVMLWWVLRARPVFRFPVSGSHRTGTQISGRWVAGPVNTSLVNEVLTLGCLSSAGRWYL